VALAAAAGFVVPVISVADPKHNDTVSDPLPYFHIDPDPAVHFNGVRTRICILLLINVVQICNLCSINQF
jgi:hypothetical protein